MLGQRTQAVPQRRAPTTWRTTLERAITTMSMLGADAPAKVMMPLAAVALIPVTGASVADGSIAPVVMLVAGWVLLFGLIRLVAQPVDMGWLRAVVLGAFLLRCGVAAVLYVRSLAIGGDGFVTGDDRLYASAAWHLVRYLRGDPELPFVPPDWGGEGFLHGNYVNLETAIFFIFGPHLLAMILVNATFAGATIVLIADIARRVFGRAASVAAAVVLAVYPSMVLWSATNIRDAMVVFFVTLCIWALYRFPGRFAAAWIAVAFLAAWVEIGLRRYLEAGLAVIIPITIALAPVAMSRSRRIRWTLVASVVSAALLRYSGSIGELMAPVTLLSSFQNIRDAMSGGRTGFVPTAPPASFPASAAPTSAVATAVPTVVPTAMPTLELAVIAAVAAIGIGWSVTLFIALRTRPRKSSRIVVALGGIVLASVVALSLFVSQATGSGPNNVPLNTLAHLPRGVAYALFAPFPWDIRGWSDAAALPDMFVWYVILVAAGMTVWRDRGRWRWFVPQIMFVIMAFGVFVLAEGNVGTLFRHRGMVIPFVLVLASPWLATIAQRLLARVPARVVAPLWARTLD